MFFVLCQTDPRRAQFTDKFSKKKKTLEECGRRVWERNRVGEEKKMGYCEEPSLGITTARGLCNVREMCNAIYIYSKTKRKP